MSEELVDVVDEQDLVVGTAARTRMRAERLLHRVASVLVFRPDGRLLVHRRTDTKDVFPGAFDCFVSGVVTAGEEYEQARDRELAEEIGIEGGGAIELFRHRYEGTDDRSWSAIYAITWDGPVVPQASEIAWHGWEPIARVLRRAEEPTFVPDGREVLHRWLDEGARLPPGTVGSARVKILTVGGTRFFGRAFVEEAARRGHEVAVFHRGEWEPADLADVEHLHGDRKAGLELLHGRSWDAALDTCAFVPRDVTELADATGDRIGHYTVVSSLSVHPDDLPVGATEDTATYPPPYPDTEDVTDQTYGPLKVACEVEAAARFAGRLLVIRPGYIGGPHDPTDRFTSWVRRAAAGGEMLAAGPPDAPIQGIDARDLGTFVLDRIEAADRDTYGVVGPAEPATTAGVLEAARAAGGADTSFVWADPEFVLALGEQHETWFPMWHPHLPGFHAYDAGKATAAGLRPRPFERTIADTLAWDRDRGEPPLDVGMTPEQERELLQAWRARAS